MSSKLERNLSEFEETTDFKALVDVIIKTTISDHFKSIINACYISCLFLPIIIHIGVNSDTIEKTLEITVLFNNISIALFGIVFTAYGLFQALLTDELILKLMKTNTNGRTYYSNYNIFFVKTSLYYLFLIILNTVVYLYLKNLKADFFIKILPHAINNSLAIILLSIYFILNMYGMVLVKSVLFNIFQASNIKAHQITCKNLEKRNE